MLDRPDELLKRPFEREDPNHQAEQARRQRILEALEKSQRMLDNLDAYHARKIKCELERKKSTKNRSWLPFGLGLLALWFWNS